MQEDIKSYLDVFISYGRVAPNNLLAIREIETCRDKVYSLTMAKILGIDPKTRSFIRK